MTDIALSYVRKISPPRDEQVANMSDDYLDQELQIINSTIADNINNVNMKLTETIIPGYNLISPSYWIVPILVELDRDKTGYDYVDALYDMAKDNIINTYNIYNLTIGDVLGYMKSHRSLASLLKESYTFYNGSIP